jgi:large repetitive protein
MGDFGPRVFGPSSRGDRIGSTLIFPHLTAGPSGILIVKRGNPQTKSSRPGRLVTGQRHRRLTLESLESRQLLAAAIGSGGPSSVAGYGLLDNVAPRNVGAVTAFQFNERELATGRGLNDSISTAELLPLGTGPGQQNTIDVNGFLPPRQTGTLTGTLAEDTDFFAANLRAGDILDIATLGAAGTFDVFLPDGRYWFGTDSNQAVFYPANSPLMTLGNATGAQVAPMAGRYTIRVARGPVPTDGSPIGATAYRLGLRVYRPVLEQQPIGVQQKVFLDFDGAIIPGSVLPGITGTLRVPSLADSLNLINLTPQEENILIDKVLVAVQNRFASVVQFGGNGNFNATGIPGQFGIQIFNSRDHADPGDDPFTTRAVIGGSTADIQIPDVLGISTILDVGNFNPGGLVFLPVEFFEDAVIDIPRVSSRSLLDILAERLATTIAHELGHSFGLRHTDPLNARASIIDTGGTLQVQLNGVGVGPDGIYGTIDDTPIVFPQFDRFDPVEGFFGNQWVAASLAWSLASGTQGTVLTGTVFNDLNRDASRGSNEPGLGGITVFVDANGNGVLNAGEISTTTNPDGTYSLAAPAGTNTIAALAPAGFIFTTAASRSVAGGATNVNFGLHRPNTQFTGRKFADLNGNGFADAGEPGIQGVFVYIDLDRDGQIDIGEPRGVTDSNGNFTLNFSGLPAGAYTVREVVGPGFEQTSPASGFYTVNYDGLNPPVGLDFGNRPSRDFGDAPDSYKTLQASGGPSHGIVPGMSLGARVDRDLDGQPSASATGDDSNGAIDPATGQVLDDEDGVRVLTPIAPGSTATFEVTITNTTGQTGFLQAWFDFNKDGSFTGTGEQVVRNLALPTGVHRIPVQIPAGVAPGNLFTRWRYSATSNLGIGGAADSGEVEDHLFTVVAQPKVANDDVATVSRNSSANPIAVLANDFETPENQLRITGVNQVALGTRGQITVAPGGRELFYTPPIGFIGQDRFTYTVTPQVGPASTATVTVNVTFQSDVPVALDDTFEVPQGSNNIALNVLDNDLPSSFGGNIIVSVTPGTQGGLTSIAGGGQSVRYTPRVGFAGTEEFTYTLSDAAGNISSAKATINLLPGSRADDVVEYSIEFLDVVNLQPITNIQAGSEFFARVKVKDLREDLVPRPIEPGVFSAFLDLLYTDELVAVRPDPSNPFGFDIQFGSRFQTGTGLQSGNATTPGLLDEVGSQRSSIGGTQPEGAVELFTVRFQAVAPGIAVFSSNPADVPINETTVFGRQTALAVNELRLGISEIVISPSGVSLSSAIDDAFPVGRDSNGNAFAVNQPAVLDVLRNDLKGPTGVVSELVLLTQPTNGLAEIQNGVVVYRPNVLNRFDSFSYVLVTGDGVRSTAEVTLFSGDPIALQNTAPTNAKPFDVDINLRVVDGAGNPITRVSPGARFGVQVIVQDLRSASQANPQGVFAAFSDILYDANLATPSTVMGGNFDFDVVFGPAFGTLGAFGSANRLGVIDEFGSFLGGTDPSGVGSNPGLTGSPVLLATLYFDAVRTVSGQQELRFVSSPADASPFRDTLLFQPAMPVPVPRIRYNVASVLVGSGSGEGETRQNALLPADVNSDGAVSPMDALLVINEISRSRTSASGEALSTQLASLMFTDVNGDGMITPMDALHVINHISRSRQGDAPADVNQLLSLTAGAGGITPVDTYAALSQLLASVSTLQSDSSSGNGGAEGERVAEGELKAAPMIQSAADDDDEDDDDILDLLADDVASLWQ